MKHVLRRLQLWQKFAAIGVIGTVMCAIPMTISFQYKNSEIAVAEKELEGTAPARAAISLQRNLQAHRGFCLLYTSPSPRD